VRPQERDGLRRIILCVVLIMFGCASISQAQFQVLYNFGSYPSDGSFPGNTPVLDGTGNIYGTTTQGGTQNNGGIVFELSNSGGTWNETTLYSFCTPPTCPSGAGPVGLVLDSSGNIFGMTTYGGVQPCPSSGVFEGCGVAFELSAPSARGGAWTYTVLYTFCSVGELCEDGANPLGPLVLDKLGNLYGTTSSGGTNDAGVVFELSHDQNGWTQNILYSFCSAGGDICSDGAEPEWGVTFDNSGNLFGTTSRGGDGGVLYKLSLSSGDWTETVVNNFPPPEPGGSNSPGPVSVDALGNLYTTLTHFPNHEGFSNGLVGRLNTSGDARVFRFNGTNGKGPFTGVIVDASRRALYGTTLLSPFGPGNVFRIDKLGQETVLYTFCQQKQNCADGNYPSGLAEDKFGSLYGTTEYGGINGSGIVFEITP